MTTAAHVLLPREVVERLRELAQEALDGALSEREYERWFPIVTALDAALNAPEMWERTSPLDYQLQGGVLRYRLTRFPGGRYRISNDVLSSLHIDTEDIADVARMLLAADGEGRG